MPELLWSNHPMRLLIQLLFAIAALLISQLSLAVVNNGLLQSSAYLGIAVDAVPEAVKAHFPDEVAGAKGLMVIDFPDYSPAADDGIHEYDILIAYEDQPIDDPQKFLAAISTDKVGQIVKFKVIRQGEILTIPVTLGEQKVNPAGQYPQNPQSISFVQQNQRTANQPRSPQFQDRIFTGDSRYLSRDVSPTAPLNITGKPIFAMQKKIVREKNAWGDERNIWPDFYTDSTNDMWDNMINGPFKMGRMPGGWRAPSLSMPDPVTIGDAVTNQLPPMAEEMGNMVDIPD
jgi:hypothetical protein